MISDWQPARKKLLLYIHSASAIPAKAGIQMEQLIELDQ